MMENATPFFSLWSRFVRGPERDLSSAYLIEYAFALGDPLLAIFARVFMIAIASCPSDFRSICFHKRFDERSCRIEDLFVQFPYLGRLSRKCR